MCNESNFFTLVILFLQQKNNTLECQKLSLIHRLKIKVDSIEVYLRQYEKKEIHNI